MVEPVHDPIGGSTDIGRALSNITADMKYLFPGF
jgi:hypothetical protein